MKRGTSCTRCANAATCPKFDSNTLYGFCRGFEPRRKRKRLRRAYRALRWLKIWGMTLAMVRVGEFFKNWGKMEVDKKEMTEAERQAELHWDYIEGVLKIHDEIDDRIVMCGHHYKTAFVHGWKHGQEDLDGKSNS